MYFQVLMSPAGGGGAASAGPGVDSGSESLVAATPRYVDPSHVQTKPVTIPGGIS
jgi:hypothetical protein